MKIYKLLLVFAVAVSLSACSNQRTPEEKALAKVLQASEKHNSAMKYKAPKSFKIYDAGTEEWIDYEKYGEFQNLGTDKYKYASSRYDDIRQASGEGIYPNTQSVYDSPEYKKYAEAGKLSENHWQFVNSGDFQADFYKWATTREDPGVKLYFTAYALDKAGNYKHAVKAYYACLVFFPKSVGWTEFKTPWYIGPVCIDRINYLTKKHNLGVKLEGAEVIIDNAFDNNIRNDVYKITPGKLVPAKAKDFERKYINLEEIGVKNTVGEGKTKLVAYNNGHFQLMVDGKPYIIRGMTYGPNKVGLYPGMEGFNNNSDWTHDDYDNNGKVDGPFDAWVDANRNEKQDKAEVRVGDFALMKEMGVNTLRIYHTVGISKELLKEGYEKYGFMYLIGNFVGMYAVDSGASWEDGTDYNNPAQRKNMLASVKKMVEDYKDEPYVLMWVLGNENNYSTIGDAGTSSNVDSQPEAYYKFANEVAKFIKELDPQKRPVAISNGDLGFINYFAKYCPDIDIFGTNSYRGEQGFGALWQDVARYTGKPVFITEFGCPAFAKGWTTARIEEAQASYHKGNWDNIADNMAGVVGGQGNSLGGVIFEWSDEWWKAQGDSDPFVHDETAQYGGAFLDGRGYEEWYGLVGLGDGQDSTFKRQLRKSYFMYRDLWKEYKK